jgi:uncharacterized lipoprotein NlpE involved in copper resistance
MKWFCMSFFCAAVYLSACSDGGSSQQIPEADTAKQVMAAKKPSGPPEKVSGVFKGMLPCADCAGIEAILTIKGDSYNCTRLFRGMKTRGANIDNKTGSCVFDSGIVKLLDNGKVLEMYRIVSEDTIRALDTTGKPLKTKMEYLLVKKVNGGN